MAQLGGATVATDGYGWLTQYVVALTTIGMSVAGLWVVVRMLRHVVEKRYATVAGLLLFTTTPLWYYTMVDPLNSHSATFLLSASIAAGLVAWQRQRVASSPLSFQEVAGMGVLVGALALVRNQDIVIGIPVLWWLVIQPQRSFVERIKNVIVFGSAVTVVGSTQLFITQYLFGTLNSPYLLSGETFQWVRPDFWRVLMSPGNGFFAFAPLALVAVITLVAKIFPLSSHLIFRLNRRENSEQFLACSALIVFVTELYIIAAWSPEIIGGPYGSRMFVSTLPWLSVGIAWWGKQWWDRGKIFQIGVVGLGTVLALNTLIQTIVMMIRY